MAKLTPEKVIEHAILNWLNSLEACFAFKVNTGGVWDTKQKRFRKNHNPHLHNGTHDIIGCYRAQFFSVEVKAGYGKASQNQLVFAQRIKRCLGWSVVTNDLEKFKKAFIDRFGAVVYSISMNGEKVLFDEKF